MGLSNDELLALVEDEAEKKDDDSKDDVEVKDEKDETVVEDDIQTDDSDTDDDQTDDSDDTDDDESDEETDEDDDTTDQDDKEETFTVKVNDEEQSVTRDELIRGYSSNKAAQEKFRQADIMQKQSESLIDMMRTNPVHVFEQLGMDPRQLAEQYLAQQLKLEQLSPAERELIDAKYKLSTLEQQRLDDNQKQHDKDMIVAVETAKQEYVTRINTALDTAGLPQTDWTVQRMAKYMHEAVTSDDPSIKKLEDSDIVELVVEDYNNELSSMSAETLEKILGSKVAKTLRTADIKKIKGKKKSTKVSTNPVKGNGVKSNEKKMNSQEWNDYLDSLN